MADAKSLTIPFANRGLVTKLDPALLQPGQFSELVNLVSEREGSLQVRKGNRRLTDNGSFGTIRPSILHSIAKLRVGDTDTGNFIYVGEGENVWRATGLNRLTQPLVVPAAGPMDFGTFPVAQGVAAVADPFPKQRWTAQRYNAGTIGKPYLFVAGPQKMVKDDGSFATLQNWGILPPGMPIIAVPDKLTLLPSGVDVVALNGGVVNRVSTTVSTVDTSSDGATPNFPKITPAAMTNIIPGMLMAVSDGATTVFTVVEIVTKTYFQAYFENIPGAGDTLQSTEKTVGNGETFAININAAFDGRDEDAFETDDLVHIAVNLSDPLLFEDIRFRVLVGGTTTDYYEKAVTRSTLQEMARLLETPEAALRDRTNLVARAIVGEGPDSFAIREVHSEGAKPKETKEASASPATPVWTEIDIPKTQFRKHGNAGGSGFTWENVTGFQIAFVGTGVLKIGSVYFAGGYGPNNVAPSLSQKFEPYDWRYTNRNPNTGHEGNPSAPMIPENFLRVGRRRVGITMGGTGDPQVTGEGSFAVYRRGGNFTDGLYRFVGWTTNPGDGMFTTFYDAASDESIQDNKILEFDNDAPVTSTLRTPIRTKWTHWVAGSTGVVGFNTFGVDQDVSALRPGTVVTIAIGSAKEESAIVISTGPSRKELTLYFQYDHTDVLSPGAGGTTFITCNAVANQPARLSALAFDSLFVAGDPNNRHTLYRSKTGRPESFPVKNFSSGAVHQINVGSPSDPIMAITEFGGDVVSMNLSHIYLVRMWQGAMQTPIETPAQRGLVAEFAWCKADNEIWYLAYDGVYSWAGGQATKRSEAIDWMFKDRVVGGISPLDKTHLDVVTFAYYQNAIYIQYLAKDGNYRRLVYETLYDRWHIDEIKDAISGTTVLTPLTAQFVEQDVNRLLIAKSVLSGGDSLGMLYQDDFGASEGWVASDPVLDPLLPTDGASFVWAFKTAAYTLGDPVMNKQFLDVVLEWQNDTQAGVTMQVFYNFSASADATDTISVPSPATANAGRVRIPMPLQVAGDSTTFGKEAYACELRFTNGAFGTFSVTFFSVTFHYFDLAQIERGMASDWDDLGHPGDKRLYQLILEYDPIPEAPGLGLTPQNQTVTLHLDTITGLPGAQQVNTGVQSFSLTPVTNTSGAPARAEAPFPIIDGIICKKIRLRPIVPTLAFKRWGYRFIKEDYPPDISRFTQWSDYGYQYTKLFQQLVIDINTAGVACEIKVETDQGVTLQTLTVTTTENDRKRLLTLKPALEGKKARLLLNPGAGGAAQLWSHDLIFVPADRGPVYHSFDWDLLGWPHDKRLAQLVIEYDFAQTLPTANVTINMDTLTGIKGGTINLIARTFVLDQGGRAIQDFAIEKDVIVKAVRLRPVDTSIQFKQWKYHFEKIDLPPDIVRWTDWSNYDWPYEKIFRVLKVDIDTGGVACTIDIEGDGAVMQTITVTTSLTDRERIIGLNSDLIAKQARLVLTPGPNGKAQLFEHHFEFVKEPPIVLHGDTYEQTWGHEGYKLCKQAWFEYLATGGLIVKILRDTGQLLISQSLPAHTKRDVERFYLPAFVAGTPNILNKSKRYRVQFDSGDGVNPFKIYADASGLEILALSADQRSAYRQVPLSQFLQFPI